MISSIQRLISGTFIPASVAVLVFSLGGCAEVMTNTRVERERGIKLYNEGQYADAAGSFRETIRHNPADVQTHYYLAQSLDHLGAYEQAIQQYRTTLGIMEKSLEGQENRALRLTALEQLATAVSKAQDRDPTTAMLHEGKTAEDQYLRAKIESKLGDADAALEAYLRSTLLDGKDAVVHRDYGLYLAQLGQTERARLELKRAYALNPSDEQTTAGLRRVGVVPGPSLKDESDMAHPLVPVGPIPELNIPGLQQPAPGTADGQRAAVSPKD
jgi:tetratricopeptide (TPR) repeat protein